MKSLFKVWMLLFLICFVLNEVNSSNSLSSSRGRSRPKTLSSKKLLEVAKMTDLNKIIEDIRHLTIERSVGSAGHDRVEKYILDFFAGLSHAWRIETDTFESETPHRLQKFTNIIAHSIDHDKSSNKNIIVVAAHYDSKYYSSPRHFVGATDSAASCAMMLDIARTLSTTIQQTEKRPRFKLVFFDGEEAFQEWTDTDSIYGSRHLAKLWSEDYSTQKENTLQQIETFILLDLLGAAKPKMYSHFESSQWLFDRLISIEKKLTEAKFFGNRFPFFQVQKIYNADLQDDHVPFVNEGVSCLHLIPLPYPSTWHTDEDNFNNLHPQTIYELTSILRVFFVEYLQLQIS